MVKQDTISNNIQEGRDPGFVDYKQPDEIPEAKRPEAIGGLSYEDQFTRRGEHDASMSVLRGVNDPILIHMRTMQALMGVIDVDSPDDTGQIALPFVAQRGDTETIEKLSEKGSEQAIAIYRTCG
ncbi:hypothetical protein FBEOM_5322 [Fusarium beomiforme]|uniref:Uncharacterized protein n=1 Tax=Fusarium beomiforme TaxID=44412 RepID=A0A9P5AL46_9HYPO|nr:hypothetical protein FBEOM_5322 [Fusarium beomiforme]